jgi:DNA-binding MarR family transcriptional regulator
MHYYGQKLLISRPNMTTLADKLIKEGLLKRQADENDRRIIDLIITPKGEKFLKLYRGHLKKSITKRLGLLEDKDIERLNKNFDDIRTIFSKLDELDSAKKL